MNQNHLRLLRLVVIAVRHRDRRHLVRHDYRLNICRILGGGPGQRLNDWNMVGPGIRKQITDSPQGSDLLQKSLSSSNSGLVSHGSAPLKNTAEKRSALMQQ